MILLPEPMSRMRNLNFFDYLVRLDSLFSSGEEI